MFIIQEEVFHQPCGQQQIKRSCTEICWPKRPCKKHIKQQEDMLTGQQTFLAKTFFLGGEKHNSSNSAPSCDILGINLFVSIAYSLCPLLVFFFANFNCVQVEKSTVQTACIVNHNCNSRTVSVPEQQFCVENIFMPVKMLLAALLKNTVGKKKCFFFFQDPCLLLYMNQCPPPRILSKFCYR